MHLTEHNEKLTYFLKQPNALTKICMHYLFKFLKFILTFYQALIR